jgi:MarR-like DNA-binding transcriptional regulator SgrR of sgrS sRNA
MVGWCAVLGPGWSVNGRWAIYTVGRGRGRRNALLLHPPHINLKQLTVKNVLSLKHYGGNAQS